MAVYSADLLTGGGVGTLEAIARSADTHVAQLMVRGIVEQLAA